MNSGSYLLAAKVLLLVAAGAAFVWWQMRDLAQEKKRTAEREAKTQDRPLL
jgi:hypothetical protein